MASRTRTTGINGVSVTVLVAGGVILVSGLTGHSISDTIRGFLAGTAPKPVLPVLTGVDQSVAGVTGEHSGPGSNAKNKALGRLLAAPYGWSTGPQWEALDNLWTHESGWSNTAKSSIGAYGIPQAYPASKMGALANPPVSSASAQIQWGLRYIKQRYGSPVNAWGYESSHLGTGRGY